MTKLSFISRYITCFQIFHINTDKFIDLRNPTYLPVMWQTVVPISIIDFGQEKFFLYFSACIFNKEQHFIQKTSDFIG